MRPAGELVFIEAHERFRVAPSRQLQEEMDAQFGDDTYYAKVDTSLPEKQPRRWEKKSNGDDSE